MDPLAASPMTRHHLRPISRGGTNDPWNIRLIPELLHRAWHLVFDVQLPEECLQHLLNILPPRSVDWVEAKVRGNDTQEYRHIVSPKMRTTTLAAWDLLFPDKHPLAILRVWYGNWVPLQYFTKIVVSIDGKLVTLAQERDGVVVDTPHEFDIDEIRTLTEPKKLGPRPSRVRKIRSTRPLRGEWYTKWSYQSYVNHEENHRLHKRIRRTA